MWCLSHAPRSKICSLVGRAIQPAACFSRLVNAAKSRPECGRRPNSAPHISIYSSIGTHRFRRSRFYRTCDSALIEPRPSGAVRTGVAFHLEFSPSEGPAK